MTLEQIAKVAKYHFGNTGWIAVDEDLRVYWYDVCPHPSEHDFFCMGGEFVLVCTKYTGDKDWKNSLTKLDDTYQCLSCENHWFKGMDWYCSIELTNPNNKCAGYNMRGGLDE